MARSRHGDVVIPEPFDQSGAGMVAWARLADHVAAPHAELLLQGFLALLDEGMGEDLLFYLRSLRRYPLDLLFSFPFV
jgi:hypothetical protein